MEAAAVGRLGLGDEDAWRVITLADRLELHRVSVQRILRGERRGIVRIAQRNDDRHHILLRLQVGPGLAPGIVLPQLRTVRGAVDRYDQNRIRLLGRDVDVVAREELLHLGRQEAHGEGADVAAGTGGFLLDRQRAQEGGDVLRLHLGLELIGQFG